MSSKRQPQIPSWVKSAARVHLRSRSHSLPEAVALAGQEHDLGNLASALEIYDFILAQFPGQAVVHNNRGAVLQKMKRYEAALAAYVAAIALKSDYANAYYNRGSVLKLLGRYDEALASFDQTLMLQPDHARALNSRGTVLQEIRRLEEAMASYDRAVASRPDYAEACNNRGTALVSLGNMAEAEQMFQKAAALKPDFPDPLYNLANIRRYQDADHPDARKIRALLERPEISSGDQEYLLFALGKIYDDCANYPAAFECFQQANRIRNAQVAYQPGEVTKLADESMAVFTETFLAQVSRRGSDSRVPLFIVGMPRSGTTLLASVLSNHAAVASAGELSAMRQLAASLSSSTGGNISYPRAVLQVDPALAARLVRDYESQLIRGLGRDATYVIDKNPLNFWHLGLIAALFPEARIIHCTRHPFDTGLSNYFRRFPLYLDYAFDLGNIGHFYNEYLRLMAHWRQIGVLHMLEVSYEDVILNTEPTVHRVLDFLGLDWDERCLLPHTNPNPVESASQWQVRQPIYRHSLGRWRHYESQLAPLIAACPNVQA